MARIFVIAEATAVRLIFKHILYEGCHKVIEAEDGQTWIGIFKAKRPDLVIVEMMMHEISGERVATHNPTPANRAQKQKNRNHPTANEWMIL
jgi:CheY-like chemotaxis protein